MVEVVSILEVRRRDPGGDWTLRRLRSSTPGGLAVTGD
jgi:hypothetical protein